VLLAAGAPPVIPLEALPLLASVCDVGGSRRVVTVINGTEPVVGAVKKVVAEGRSVAGGSGVPVMRTKSKSTAVLSSGEGNHFLALALTQTRRATHASVPRLVRQRLVGEDKLMLAFLQA
jgi:hypothetical protein